MITTRKYKLVIFDWDGTVMDSIGRIVSSMQNAALQAGLECPNQTDVENIIGMSLPKAIPVLFPNATHEQESLLLKHYKDEYISGNKIATPLFEGVLELLTKLKESGVLLAVATGKGRIGLNRVMAETHTTDFFQATWCGDEAQSKPHPEMLERLLAHFKLEPSDALMIGDTSFDMEMAQRAGVDSIAVTYGVHPREVLMQYFPVNIADSISQLTDLLCEC